MSGIRHVDTVQGIERPTRNGCVLIYSGGLDSTVLLYLYRKKQAMGDLRSIAALSVNYGQRHVKELDFARSLCQKHGIRHEVVDLTSIRSLLISSQTTKEIPVPRGHYEDESMKMTVVPNRNAIMLSIAMGWAISLGYESVVYGAHGGDHAIYPDCRPDFVEAMNIVGRESDHRRVKVEAPFLTMNKSDLVSLGVRLFVPFSLTWSCYEGKSLHCGTCATCIERREAFFRAGIRDDTEYACSLVESFTAGNIAVSEVDLALYGTYGR